MHIAGEGVVESICFGGGEVCQCAKTKRCNGQVASRQLKDLCLNELPADCSNTNFRSSANSTVHPNYGEISQNGYKSKTASELFCSFTGTVIKDHYI